MSPPTNPDDGEHVVEVLTLPPKEAADYLREHDDTHADVVLLAVALGLV
ncbi:MAG: hydrolase [Nocardioides sp.]|nr:hydrolase [Nocardioides sp.]